MLAMFIISIMSMEYVCTFRLKKGEIGWIKKEKWTEKINVNHKCWLYLYYIYNANSVVYDGYG